jgi:hypothetical protein
MGGLTTAARRFAEINRSARIISGQWLDSDSRPVTGHPDTWAKLRYRFDNGRQATLRADDLASLRAAAIEPKWLNDVPDQSTETER